MSHFIRFIKYTSKPAFSQWIRKQYSIHDCKSFLEGCEKPPAPSFDWDHQFLHRQFLNCHFFEDRTVVFLRSKNDVFHRNEAVTFHFHFEIIIFRCLFLYDRFPWFRAPRTMSKFSRLGEDLRCTVHHGPEFVGPWLQLIWKFWICDENFDLLLDSLMRTSNIFSEK